MKKRFVSIAALAVLTIALEGAASAAMIYDNTTASTGQTAGWLITFPFAAANSFNVSTTSTLTSFNFWVWEQSATGGAAPDVLKTVDWYIATDNGINAPLQYPFQNILSYNQYGGATSSVTPCSQCTSVNTSTGWYNVFEESVSIPNVLLTPGKYWLVINNAVPSSKNLIYWDISNGSSLAYYANSTASDPPTSINSESFQILGDTTGDSSTPEPGTLAMLSTGLLLMAGACRRMN